MTMPWHARIRPPRAHDTGPGLRAPRHIAQPGISYCRQCGRVIIRGVGRWWEGTP